MFYDGESFTGTAYSLYNNEDTKLEFEIQFKDGKINGSAKKWTKGGDIKLEDYFKDGKKNGIQKEWRGADEGKRYLYSELNYLDDKLHGKSTYWYYGGEKTCTIENFKFGKKDGVQKRWNSDGTFDYERNYIDGKWIKD